MENLQIDTELNEANVTNEEQINHWPVSKHHYFIHLVSNTSYSLEILSELSFTCKYIFLNNALVARESCNLSVTPSSSYISDKQITSALETKWNSSVP